MNSEFAGLTPQEIAALLGRVDELVERRISEARLTSRLEQVKAGRMRPPTPWSVFGRKLRQLLANARLRADRGRPVLAAVPSPGDGPAIESIAADLRRLHRQRLGIASQSTVWHVAVLRAYDERLRLASRCMGIAEHLAHLTGMDLEVERLRVEEELIRAGLVLRLGSAPDRTASPED